MLTTALLLMFTAADVQPAFLTGSAPRKVRLVADEVLPPPPPEALPSYAGWTRGQLRAEYDRLGEKRPSLGMPIALMSSGGGALTLTAYILLGILGGGGVSGADIPLLVIIGVIATASAGTVVIGGIVLSRLLPERKIYGAQMEEVDRLIKESNEENPQRDDRQYVPPPPPPAIIGPPPEGPPPLPLPPFNPQSSISFPLIFVRL